MAAPPSAMTKRSLNVIRAELEFLLDAEVISPSQYQTITNALPGGTTNPSSTAVSPAPVSSIVAPLQNLNVQEKKYDEKKHGYYATDAPDANPAPPAYPSAPPAPVGPPVLTRATAMYQYNAQDAGDLALMPNDQIVVHEYMNAEWWKGRNERTGQEGIFPRSYVKVDEKSLAPPVNGAPQPSNYGNMPLDVSNGAGGGDSKEPSKGGEMGKKFGKKLGNAAIFGAGATIGGKIVNGIF